jgi:cell shape-determining protein MreC
MIYNNNIFIFDFFKFYAMITIILSIISFSFFYSTYSEIFSFKNFIVKINNFYNKVFKAEIYIRHKKGERIIISFDQLNELLKKKREMDDQEEEDRKKNPFPREKDLHENCYKEQDMVLPIIVFSLVIVLVIEVILH